MDPEAEAGKREQDDQADAHDCVEFDVSEEEATNSNVPRLDKDDRNNDYNHDRKRNGCPRLSLDVMRSEALNGYPHCERIVVQSANKGGAQV